MGSAPSLRPHHSIATKFHLPFSRILIILTLSILLNFPPLSLSIFNCVGTLHSLHQNVILDFHFPLPFMLCRLMCLIDKDPLDQPRPFRPCLQDFLLHFPLTFALIHLHLMHFLDFHLLSLLLLFLPCAATNSLWVCLPTGPSPPSI